MVASIEEFDPHMVRNFVFLFVLYAVAAAMPEMKYITGSVRWVSWDVS